MSSTTSPPPLEGITVVSLEQAVAAPFATRQLPVSWAAGELPLVQPTSTPGDQDRAP